MEKEQDRESTRIQTITSKTAYADAVRKRPEPAKDVSRGDNSESTSDVVRRKKGEKRDNPLTPGNESHRFLHESGSEDTQHTQNGRGDESTGDDDVTIHHSEKDDDLEKELNNQEKSSEEEEEPRGRSRSPPRSRKRRRRSRSDSRSRHRGYRCRSPVEKKSSSLVKILSKKKINEYRIDDRLEKHFREHSNVFVPDADLEFSFLVDHPVPGNIKKARVLDPVLETMLNEDNKQIVVKQDESLKRVQKKVIDVLGPLSKVWTPLEKAAKDTSDSVFLDLPAMAQHMQEATALLGQAVVTINHFRRRRVLTGLTSNNESNRLIKQHKDVLEEDNDELFGYEFREDFRDHKHEVSKNQKAIKNPNNNTNKKSGGGNLTRVVSRQPFPRGSSSSYRGGGGGQQRFPPSSTPPARGGQGYKGKTSYTFSATFKGISKGSILSPPDLRDHSSSEPNHSTRRKVEVFCRPMGKGHQRSRDSEHSSGLGHTFHEQTHTEKGYNKHPKGRLGGSKPGNSQTNRERGHQRSLTSPRPNSIKPFPQGEERRVTKANLKSEKFKRIYPLHALQNGKLKGRKERHKGERLDDKNRSEGCVFYTSPKPGISKVCQVPVGREVTRVPMPVFRPGTSPKIIHKAIKGTCVDAQKDKHSASDLSRRSDNFRGIYGRDHDGQGLYDLSFGEPRFRDKLREVDSNSYKKHRVFGSNHRQHSYDHVSNRGENNISHKTVRQSQEGKDYCPKEPKQSVGETNSHCSSSDSLHAAGTTLTTGSHLSHKEGQQLQPAGALKQGGHDRIILVDRKPSHHSGKTHADKPPRYNNSFGCSRGSRRGLGSGMSRDRDRRSIYSRGKSVTHKQKGNDCSGHSHSNFHPDVSSSEVHSFNGGQHLCSQLHSKNGRHSKPGHDRKGQEPVDLSPREEHSTNGGVHTIDFERVGGQTVQKCTGLERMEVRSRHLPKDHRLEGDTGRGLVCLQNVPSIPTLHESEGGPMVPKSRCTTTVVETHVSLCFSPIQSVRKGLKESTEREGPKNVANCPNLGHTTLVPSGLGDVGGQSNSAPSTGKHSQGPTRGLSPHGFERDSTTRGLDCLRPNEKGQGFSPRVTELLNKARSEGTRLNYNSAWQKFSSWCSGRKIDPIYASMSDTLEFLTSLHDQGLKYRTINNYRSAISAKHALLGRTPIGQHPEVCQLMKAIGRENPPVPKYCSTWDVSTLLDFIRFLGDNKQLTNKGLTLKLATLLAITSSHRGAELRLLKLNRMNIHAEYIQFQFDEVLKTSEQGETLPNTKFYTFEDEAILCPANCLTAYIKRTVSWRNEGKEQHLFLSHINPHMPIKKSPTIARWIKEFLGDAGIDISTYQAHSTRGASCSKAKAKGLSVEDIVKQANWTNSSTFEKFYHKPIVDHTRTFQRAVLGQH